MKIIAMQIISEKYTALDAVRSLNSCRRRWNGSQSGAAVLTSLWKVKAERTKKFGLPENFDRQLKQLMILSKHEENDPRRSRAATMKLKKQTLICLMWPTNWVSFNFNLSFRLRSSGSMVFVVCLLELGIKILCNMRRWSSEIRHQNSKYCVTWDDWENFKGCLKVFF